MLVGPCSKLLTVWPWLGACVTHLSLLGLPALPPEDALFSMSEGLANPKQRLPFFLYTAVNQLISLAIGVGKQELGVPSLLQVTSKKHGIREGRHACILSLHLPYATQDPPLRIHWFLVPILSLLSSTTQGVLRYLTGEVETETSSDRHTWFNPVLLTQTRTAPSSPLPQRACHLLSTLLSLLPLSGFLLSSAGIAIFNCLSTPRSAGHHHAEARQPWKVTYKNKGKSLSWFPCITVAAMSSPVCIFARGLGGSIEPIPLSFVCALAPWSTLCLACL